MEVHSRYKSHCKRRNFRCNQTIERSKDLIELRAGGWKSNFKKKQEDSFQSYNRNLQSRKNRVTSRNTSCRQYMSRSRIQSKEFCKHQREYEKMSLKLEKKAAHKIISKRSKSNIRDKGDCEERRKLKSTSSKRHENSTLYEAGSSKMQCVSRKDKSADRVEEIKTYYENENFQKRESEIYFHSEPTIDGLENSQHSNEFSNSKDKKEQQNQTENNDNVLTYYPFPVMNVRPGAQIIRRYFPLITPFAFPHPIGSFPHRRIIFPWQRPSFFPIPRPYPGYWQKPVPLSPPRY